MRFLMRKNLLGLWSSARRFFQRDPALFVSKHLNFMKQHEMCPSYWIIMNHYLSLNLCFYMIMVFVSRLVLASGLLLPALPATRADSLCVSLSQLSLSFDSLWDLVQRQSHSPRLFFWGFADVSMATTSLLRLCLLKNIKFKWWLGNGSFLSMTYCAWHWQQHSQQTEQCTRYQHKFFPVIWTQNQLFQGQLLKSAHVYIQKHNSTSLLWWVFPLIILAACFPASSSSLQTASASPCRFVAVQKPNHGFQKLHYWSILWFSVMLCFSHFSRHLPMCSTLVLFSTGEGKFHKLNKGLCTDFCVVSLDVPKEVFKFSGGRQDGVVWL